MNQSTELLDQMRQACRAQHLSYRTEQTYVDWVYRYKVFHGKRHPCELGEAEVEAFLMFLATERQMAASTQNQALCALLFSTR